MHQVDGTPQERQSSSPFSGREGVRVDNVIALVQEGEEALDECRRWFSTHAYRINKTAHFVVCQKRSKIILLHQFSRADIDADIICFLENELTSVGITPSARAFGAILFAVLASTFPAPRDQRAIWRQFSLNTLSRLRTQIGGFHPTPPTAVSYIAPFAAIYQRIFGLFTGQSLLDVGCSFGFLPVLAAERIPSARIVGCDNNPDALTFSRDLALATGIHQVDLTSGDILDAGFPQLGRFNTVTAIHVLEHLQEVDIPLALDHLLQVTSARLIIAVPYEDAAKSSYGHQQIFTGDQLRMLGEQCIEKLGGKGRYWCEDVAGGILVVDTYLPGNEAIHALP